MRPGASGRPGRVLSLGDGSMAPNEQDLSRRGALGALGVVAGGVALLNHAVAADSNPAAQVGDATSTIRITGLRTHRVQHKVYVETQTSHKVSGWGEVSALV